MNLDAVDEGDEESERSGEWGAQARWREERMLGGGSRKADRRSQWNYRVLFLAIIECIIECRDGAYVGHGCGLKVISLNQHHTLLC